MYTIIMALSSLVLSSTGFMPTSVVIRLASSHNSLSRILSSRQALVAWRFGLKSDNSSGLRRGSVVPSFFAFRS